MKYGETHDWIWKLLIRLIRIDAIQRVFVFENYCKILEEKADNGTYTLQTDEIWSYDYVELHGCLQNKPFVMCPLCWKRIS